MAERRFQDVADAAGEIQRLIGEAREIGCLAHKDADADSLDRKSTRLNSSH